MYGLYGGLHIAPFGPLKPEQETVVKSMGKYNFKKVAANHCTGLPAVQKMIELGYPVERGTDRFGSQSDLFVGNGDEDTLGQDHLSSQPGCLSGDLSSAIVLRPLHEIGIIVRVAQVIMPSP